MTDLRKAAEMAIEAITKGGVKEQAAAVYALRQALAQLEQKPLPIGYEFESLGHAMLGEGKPFYLSGKKVSLATMKPGDRFILVRTGQIYSIKDNGFIWNETEQRPSKLHKNCQVEPIVTHPKCDDSCLNVCTEGFTKQPNCAF